MVAGDRRFHLAISISVICIAAGLQISTAGSQGGPRPRHSVTSVSGRHAVASEVLVQFDSISAAGVSRPALERAVDAEENVQVGRGGLRRIRSRVFDVETLLAFFRAQPNVLFAEPNYILRADTTPDDPHLPTLWGLLNIGQIIGKVPGVPGADIAATAAWDYATGSRDNVIGIIDSGIDYTHPDLVGNVWSAPAGFDVTIGGVIIHCPAGSHGFNAIAKSCDPRDTHSHGTHVAGTIGATGNNGLGVAGVNWIASIIAARFIGDDGQGTTADAIDSIEFMIQAKSAFASTAGANIRVLNNSWGGGAFSSAMQRCHRPSGRKRDALRRRCRQPRPRH